MTANAGLPNDKSITVADYSWQFFERVKQQKYGETEEENSLVAGQNFYGLLSKLQDTGSKDDVKVPLRVLRDEIGRVYFKSTTHRMENSTIESLFKLYDSVEAECQRVLHSKPEQKEAAAATHLLEELRLRFSRLAVGDTWEAYPELKLKALKRMQAYAVKEREGKQAAAGTPTSSTGDNLAGAWPGKQRKSMKRMMSIGGGGGAAPGGVFSAWQSTIDDLGKAPAARLFPFVKLLLQEVVEGQIAVPARPSDGAAPEPSRTESEALAPAPSTVADAGVTSADTGNRLAELNLDDLLGLNDATPTAAANEQPAADDKAVGRTSDDPFAPKQAPQQQPAAGTAPDQQQSRQEASNPFGSASFTSQGSQPGGPTPNGTRQQPYGQGYHQGYGQPASPPGQYASGQQNQAGYSQGAYIQGQYNPGGHSQPPHGQGFQGQPDYAQQQLQQASSGSYSGVAYQQPSFAPQQQQQQYAPQQPGQPRQQQYAQPLPQGSLPQALSQSLSSQHSGYLPPPGPPQPYSPQTHQSIPNPSYFSSSGGPASSQDLGPPRGSGFSLGSAPSASHSDYQSFASPLGRAPSSNPAEPASSQFNTLPGRGPTGGAYGAQPSYSLKPAPHSGQFSSHSQPQSPAVLQPTSSFSPTAPHSIHSGGGSSGFGSGGFGGGGFEQASFQAGAGQAVGSPGAPTSQHSAGNGFNPFGLQEGAQHQQQPQHLQPQSSLTYAGSQPLPPFSDNRFSDVGPVVPPVQQHNIPQPMRAPPAPPNTSGSNQYSAW